jgi:hypothetical protein
VVRGVPLWHVVGHIICMNHVRYLGVEHLAGFLGNRPWWLEVGSTASQHLHLAMASVPRLFTERMRSREYENVCKLLAQSCRYAQLLMLPTVY